MHQASASQGNNPFKSGSQQQTLEDLHQFHQQAQLHHQNRARAGSKVGGVGAGSSQNYATAGAGGSSANGEKAVSYSLRGTIEQLSTKMNDIITEITYHRQQLQIVKSESETANQMLNLKIDEMRGRTEFEEQKLQNMLEAEKNKQKKMHDYLHNQMRRLKVETDTCNAKSMALNRRVEEMEKQIGVQACVDEVTGKIII